MARNRINVTMSVRPDVLKEARRISSDVLTRENVSMLFEYFVKQHIEGEKMYKSIVENGKKLKEVQNV